MEKNLQQVPAIRSIWSKHAHFYRSTFPSLVSLSAVRTRYGVAHLFVS